MDNLWLYLTNRNVLGGGLPVLTGPAFVDSENIDVILPFVEAEYPLMSRPVGEPARASPPGTPTREKS